MSESEPRLVCSYILSMTLPNDDYAATLRIERRHGVLYLTSLWVKGDCRRKGYGTQLMDAAIKEFGHEDLYLVVQAYTDQSFGDEKLKEWYARWGFMSTDFPGGMVRRANNKTTWSVSDELSELS